MNSLATACTAVEDKQMSTFVFPACKCLQLIIQMRLVHGTDSLQKTAHVRKGEKKSERRKGGREEGGEQERNNGGCGSGQGLKRPAVVEGLAGEYNFSISICQHLFPCRRATET